MLGICLVCTYCDVKCTYPSWKYFPKTVDKRHNGLFWSELIRYRAKWSRTPDWADPKGMRRIPNNRIRSVSYRKGPTHIFLIYWIWVQSEPSNFQTFETNPKLPARVWGQSCPQNLAIFTILLKKYCIFKHFLFKFLLEKHNGIARLICVLRQEMFLHSRSSKIAEFEVKNKRSSAKEANANHLLLLPVLLFFPANIYMQTRYWCRHERAALNCTSPQTIL